MQTDEEFILTVKELPLEKKQIVFEYVDAVKDESFKVTHYSKEDTAILDQRDEDAQQGINVERFSSMSEARKSLGLT